MELFLPRLPFLPFLLVCVNCAPESFTDVKVDRYFTPIRCPREVQTEDFVRYHFNGTLEADGKQFDSSHDRVQALVSQVGSGRLLSGLDRGLEGMCVNERRKISVPPHLAFGTVGAGSVIPPNAVLVYDVLLLDIWNKDDKVQIRTLYRPEDCIRAAVASDFVRYHYNGTLLTGDMFDSSYLRNATYDTYLGQGDLIEGMEEGLLGMCVGERRVVIVPPFLGYGENGSGSTVPPQATLVYEVLMVDVFNSKDNLTVTVKEVPESCSRRSKRGDFIRYHYNGTFQDGTPFDSSYQRNSTYNTYIGKGYVMKGMDQALQGLCIGEKRRIIIPPHLAYGESGVGDLIPSWTVLVFHIHVIDFHNPKDPVVIRTTLRPPDCPQTSELFDHPQDTAGPSCCDEATNMLCVFLCAAAGVPGSAVLLFQLELVDLQKGVPDGFMFVWVEDSPEPLFPAMDLNGDKQVPLEEFSDFIELQSKEGKGRLRPGVDRDAVIKDMFYNQDSNRDHKITEEEIQLKDDTVPQRDEF
uniref:peptidylprolyl isomerase n=1 Tax=Neogobius melanostomus TaxID=47308 RepID=A0A8C6WFZ3_9GOBI